MLQYQVPGAIATASNKDNKADAVAKASKTGKATSSKVMRCSQFTSFDILPTGYISEHFTLFMCSCCLLLFRCCYGNCVIVSSIY